MRLPLQVLAPLVLALSGCAVMGGDMPIRVQGSIPESVGGSRTAQNCSLELVSAVSKKVRARQEVDAEFEVSFVIEAREAPYIFVARCEDGREFVSAERSLGGKGGFNELISLGVLSRQ